MNDILNGQSESFTVIGITDATDEDMTLLAQYMGKDTNADQYAIVEAVAFDNSKNANGWRVANLEGITTLGAGLNYDHSPNARDRHGTVFAERNDGNRKIVKVAVDKAAPKNADILADLVFKPFTSPSIKVVAWEGDAKEQVVAKGRMTHLSIVEDPAFGESNRVLSLAAEKKANEELADQQQTYAFEALGREVHEQNVKAAIRYAERKSGPFTTEQRLQARNKYESMDPLTLNGEVLPMLKEIVSARNGETSQKTIAAPTEHSSVRRPNPHGLNLSIGEK